MSRIGKLPVSVPAGVDVKIDGQDVAVKGPKGALNLTVAEPITIAKGDDGALTVSRPNDERRSRALHGLTRRERMTIHDATELRRCATRTGVFGIPEGWYQCPVSYFGCRGGGSPVMDKVVLRVHRAIADIDAYIANWICLPWVL